MITTVTLNVAVDKTVICDEVESCGITRSREALAVAGGKGINVARAISKLGGDVIATGCAGGYNGLLVRKMIEAEGIGHELLNIEDNSRMCLTIIETNTQSVTEIYDPSPTVKQQEWEKMKGIIGRLAENSDIVTLNGSLPNGLDDDAYYDLINVIRRRNPECRVILDTSAGALREGMKAKPFMMKPNKNEMEALLGHRLCNLEDEIAAVQRVMRHGISLVVLSLGSDGVVFGCKDNGKIYRVEPLSGVEVQSTVGCGDAMVGGIAKRISESADVIEAVKYGVASATSNLTSKTQADVSREQVEEFFKHVQVNRIC
jgi:tagatose 6-phosphate kinase